MERDDLVDPHDSFYAVFAACLTGFTQVQEYPRSSVDPIVPRDLVYESVISVRLDSLS